MLPLKKVELTPMKYIERIDTGGKQGGHKAWRVSIKLTTINFIQYKVFSDSHYDGQDSGLLAARAWRNKHVKKINIHLKNLERKRKAEQIIPIKRNKSNCHLVVKDDILKVLSFDKFKSMCLDRQGHNEKVFTSIGKHAACEGCDMGNNIAAGKRKTLPKNVKLINISSLDYPISIDTKKPKRKKKKIDIEITSSLNSFNNFTNSDMSEEISVSQ